MIKNFLDENNYEIGQLQFSCLDKRFQIIKTLYQGDGSSKLLLAKDLQEGRLMVVKKLKSLFRLSPFNRKKIEKEAASLSKVKHQNLLGFVHSNLNGVKSLPKNCSDKKASYLAVEYAEKGDLFNFVKASRGFKERTAMFYFRQLICGLEALHSNNVCHMDIKLENILLNSDYTLKIADLEFSKEISNQITGEKLKLKDKLGSDKYMAPELHLLSLPNAYYHGDKADVFSAGIVLLALLTGSLYFKKTNYFDDEFRQFNKNPYAYLETRLKKKGEISQKTLMLLTKILDPNFNRRMGIQEIKANYLAEAEPLEEVLSEMEGYFQKVKENNKSLTVSP